ncbi:hypothetical protein RI367_008543 [Sorochytrium milnesiophthora]
MTGYYRSIDGSARLRLLGPPQRQRIRNRSPFLDVRAKVTLHGAGYGAAGDGKRERDETRPVDASTGLPYRLLVSSRRSIAESPAHLANAAAALRQAENPLWVADHDVDSQEQPPCASLDFRAGWAINRHARDYEDPAPWQHHWTRSLAVSGAQSLPNIIKIDIIDAGSTWAQGKELLLRRKLMPGNYTSHPLDALSMAPVTKLGIADSVQTFTDRWLPKLALRGDRNSFLAKLLPAMHLRAITRALALVEDCIFDGNAPIDTITHALRALRLRAHRSYAEYHAAVDAGRDAKDGACNYCLLCRGAWKYHTPDQCFILHPEKLAAFKDKHKSLMPKVLQVILEYNDKDDLSVPPARMRNKEPPAIFDTLFVGELESVEDTRTELTQLVITGNQGRLNPSTKAINACEEKMKDNMRYQRAHDASLPSPSLTLLCNQQLTFWHASEDAWQFLVERNRISHVQRIRINVRFKVKDVDYDTQSISAIVDSRAQMSMIAPDLARKLKKQHAAEVEDT